ncbi:MAG: hypothetical protein JRI34_02350 [Deltaproteobacteria bacterium]|nr:hypothetical protein [Deltaproteobacteria bacterium]
MKIALIILAIIIIITTLSVILGSMIFNRRVKNEVAELFQAVRGKKPEVVTEEDLKGLPEPVQRYLKYAQIVGKEKVRTVRLKQKGFFRTKKEQKWMPITAEQYYTVDPPGFVWKASMQVVPLVSVKARDRYYQGQGGIIIKLLGLIKLGEVKGREIDQGTLLRYLDEMVWFPTAFLSDCITWQPIDSNSVKATISHQGLSVSAVMLFNEQGEMVNFTAERYMDAGGEFKLEKWETPFREYQEINGVKIPTTGEGVWKLNSGDFAYVRPEIIEIEYNNPSMY